MMGTEQGFWFLIILKVNLVGGVFFIEGKLSMKYICSLILEKFRLFIKSKEIICFLYKYS